MNLAEKPQVRSLRATAGEHVSAGQSMCVETVVAQRLSEEVL